MHKNKSKSLSFYLPLIGIGVVCLLLIALLIASRFPKSGGTNSEQSNANNATLINADSDVREYLSGLGWEVSDIPSSVRNVEIPSEFDETYRDYNDLQKSQGFDLSDYRAKTAVMYTFKVLNYGTHKDVFANVLVYDGRVIAGDLVSYAIDGFLKPLIEIIS